MGWSRFTEEQIIVILREQEAGRLTNHASTASAQWALTRASRTRAVVGRICDVRMRSRSANTIQSMSMMRNSTPSSSRPPGCEGRSPRRRDFRLSRFGISQPGWRRHEPLAAKVGVAHLQYR